MSRIFYMVLVDWGLGNGDWGLGLRVPLWGRIFAPAGKRLYSLSEGEVS